MFTVDIHWRYSQIFIGDIQRCSLEIFADVHWKYSWEIFARVSQDICTGNIHSRQSQEIFTGDSHEIFTSDIHGRYSQIFTRD